MDRVPVRVYSLFLHYNTDRFEFESLEMPIPAYDNPSQYETEQLTPLGE